MPAQNVDPGFDGGMLVGKRYADDQVGIELCTKAARRRALARCVHPLVVKGEAAIQLGLTPRRALPLEVDADGAQIVSS